ncbi:MAG: glycoside hydrolase family 127 protein [Clostridiales bacterium]|nr:glycoside hydrolase family 127 protein [Clostridiales bacterium]
MAYEKFDPVHNAELVMNYITTMVDEDYDNLPYWLILPHKKPAEAAHCRVDDAELVGSWYEGIDAIGKMLNTHKGDAVKESFRRHLMKSWGEHGLRFHEDYNWSRTNHASFHEMGYILPALNRIIENDPEDKEAEKRASELVRGMRSIVIERKVRTFWSGDFEETEPIYEFPNDVFLRDGGFDLTRHTGRGEQPIRNSIMLRALVRRYELTGDEVALDLARGIANYVLGVSRYFNYRMEFFGHVHSAGWVASGLVALGRITGEEKYIKSGKGIYEYIRSISSSFGWVPEYAQWHPMEEEHCETCCIKDMIECANELILAGYDEYWDDLNRFARNQLVENQVKNADYVVVDNSLPNDKENGITYRDINKRMIGGFTGGSLPNSISLTRFRSIAGCCVGMAPVALSIVWDRAITKEGSTVTVNIPLDKETDEIILSCEYPNEGKLTAKVKKNCSVGFRLYPFMGDKVEFTLNGKPYAPKIEKGTAVFEDLKENDVAALSHKIETVEKKEHVRGMDLTVLWRGCDVVDILPHGEHVRLYQRDLSVPKDYPKPEDVQYTGAVNYGPTQQKK